MTIFCFDIDGTVTEPNKLIDPIMADTIVKASKYNKIWFITGNSYDKAKRQLGNLITISDSIYCCSGSELWSNGVLVKNIDYSFSKKLIATLYVLVDKFPEKFNHVGNHITFKTGMLTLAIPGTGLSDSDRNKFKELDDKLHFREKCVNFLNKYHTDIKATLGGMTSIDITPIKGGKAIVADDIPINESVYFWGNEIKISGNDYEFANLVKERGGTVFSVDNWQQTYHSLKEIVNV